MKKILLITTALFITINLTAQVQSVEFQATHFSYNSLGVHNSHLKQYNRLSLALKSENNSFRIEDWRLGSSNIKNRFSVDINGNVGIGTPSPLNKLSIFGDIGSYSNDHEYILRSYNMSAAGRPNQFNVLHNLGDVEIRNERGNISFIGNNVGIGTTNPDAKLSVNGKIHAKEVKVDLTGWPDYVFSNTYKLPTLANVEKHIAEKGHLENIPSAKEVAKNGIELGKMNKRLLQKIEELTLYTIQQQKAIEEEKKKNNAFEKRISRLETLIISTIE